MKMVRVDNHNQHIYMNLAQAYEAEFSKIMHKKPDENGLFPLDTKLGGIIKGYLLYIEDIPAGHTAIAHEADNHFEVCDFYIVPYFRQNQVGKYFITALFKQLGGTWEIKQVAGADHAVKFWRDVVGNYTKEQHIEDSYQEDKYDDLQWGMVTRQRFNHK